MLPTGYLDPFSGTFERSLANKILDADEQPAE